MSLAAFRPVAGRAHGACAADLEEKGMEFKPAGSVILNNKAVNLRELRTETDVDLAAVARVASAADSETMVALLAALKKADALDRRFSLESLVSILSSICHMRRRQLNDDAALESLQKWHQALVQQLLHRQGSLRRRHALVLLASWNAKDAFRGSWWLAAVAMSGLELEVAAGHPEERSHRPIACAQQAEPIGFVKFSIAEV
eukprot:Skav213723  [mRNA]  locus=scaffold2563:28353:37598:+ [translate_table: standard]